VFVDVDLFLVLYKMLFLIINLCMMFIGINDGENNLGDSLNHFGLDIISNRRLFYGYFASYIGLFALNFIHISTKYFFIVTMWIDGVYIIIILLAYYFISI